MLLAVAAIDDVFTPDVLARLTASRAAVSPLASHRIDVLTAHGPYPSEDEAAYLLRRLRAERASWEAYVDAAQSTGVLDGDVIARLRGSNDAGIRSALAECMASFFFAGVLGVRLSPRPRGNRAKRLEFRVLHPLTTFNVEVKAPKEEESISGVWSGNAAPVLEATLVEASKQFPDDHAIVLVISPQLRVPIASDRYQFTQAFLGEFVTVLAIDTRTGGPAGDAETRFAPRGRFARSMGPRGPFHTRVGAVVVLEEVLVDPAAHRARFTREQLDEAAAMHDNELLGVAIYEQWIAPRKSRESMWVEIRAYVIHNPNAVRPIDPRVFHDYPQFIQVGTNDEQIEMAWSDGHRVGP